MQNQVIDENMLMMNFVNQDEIFANPSPSNSNSNIVFSPEKPRDQNTKVKSLFSESKIFQQYLKEKDTTNTMSSTVFSGSNAPGVEAVYEKKISSLNQTIMSKPCLII
jgi:mevalonate pyrophosphate decarboxylase